MPWAAICARGATNAVSSTKCFRLAGVARNAATSSSQGSPSVQSAAQFSHPFPVSPKPRMRRGWVFGKGRHVGRAVAFGYGHRAFPCAPIRGMRKNQTSSLRSQGRYQANCGMWNNASSGRIMRSCCGSGSVCLRPRGSERAAAYAWFVRISTIRRRDADVVSIMRQ